MRFRTIRVYCTCTLHKRSSFFCEAGVTLFVGKKRQFEVVKCQNKCDERRTGQFRLNLPNDFG